MSMSRKHYEAIASRIRQNYYVALDVGEEYIAEGIAIAARAVATVMEDDDPRFDRARFLNACGVPHTPTDGHVCEHTQASKLVWCGECGAMLVAV